MAKKVSPSYVPIKEVLELARQGYNDSTIIRMLKEQGYTPRQINDAFNQAKLKAAAGNAGEMEPSIMTSETENEIAAPAPSSEEYAYDYGAQAPEEETSTGEGYNYPQQTYPSYEARPSTEVIEEIAEEIINEKWRDFKTKAGDFGNLKKVFEDRLKNLALRIKRMENSMDKLNDSVISRIREYESNVRTLRAEIHALETAFSKILEPLVNNIRKIEQGSVEKEFGRLKKKEKEEEKLESLISGKKKHKRRKRK